MLFLIFKDFWMPKAVLLQLTSLGLRSIHYKLILFYFISTRVDARLLDEPGLKVCRRQTLRRTWTLKDARVLGEPGL
ncbi:hypothetical protein RhiirA4_488520 [Rhizophagus irregularis]|uniref:Uncharacterized protein n=1 Tax=Rhizophagus irregularis TaxID=588596 RepID=A0A2I1HTU9_9GLOM|nr:hypothetical protein RhiirA4_488520 [Rhizophagus irregularis]